MPFYWGHSNVGYSPKPDIVINDQTDPNFAMTDKHFERLIKTYGTPVKILNLVKKESANEKKLGELYERYHKKLFIGDRRFIKNQNDISYEWFDFFRIYNKSEAELLVYMQKLGTLYTKEIKPTVLDFSRSIKLGPVINSQIGIMRVNCVDCLDRTNNAMACSASVVLAEMLKGMNCDIEDFIKPELSAVADELLEILLNMWGANGDKVAQQYAGSDAFHKAQIYQREDGSWETLKQNIAIIAVKRYISNTLLDTEKQRTQWLFLGEYTPEEDCVKELWDFDPLDKDAQTILASNAMKHYVNIPQERVTVSEGRLRRLTLLDLRTMNFSLSLNSEKYLQEEIRFDVAVVLNKLRRKTSQNDDENELVPDFPVASSDIPRVSNSNQKKDQAPKEETKSATQTQLAQPGPEHPKPEHMASFMISSMLDPRGILASQQTLGPAQFHSSLRLQSSNFSDLAKSEFVPVPPTPPPSGIFPVLTQLSLFDSFQNETWHNPEYLLLGTNPHT